MGPYPMQASLLHQKADIRALAKDLGLSNLGKRAVTCLSSRISRGDMITLEKLYASKTRKLCCTERDFVMSESETTVIWSQIVAHRSTEW